MAGSTGPVETKVAVASTAAVVTSFAMWLLATYVFAGDVPAPVSAIVTVAVTGAFTFAAGYMARHTHRSDPAAKPRAGAE